MINRDNALTVTFTVINIVSYIISDSIRHEYVSINNYVSVLGGELFDIKSILYEIIFIVLITSIFYIILRIINNKIFRITWSLLALMMSLPMVNLYGL